MYAAGYEFTWPELQSDYLEVMQLAVDTDPGPDTLGGQDDLTEPRLIEDRREYPRGTPSPNPGAALGRTVVRFWADGFSAELLMQTTVDADGGHIVVPSFSLDGEEFRVHYLLEAGPAPELTRVPCLR